MYATKTFLWQQNATPSLFPKYILHIKIKVTSSLLELQPSKKEKSTWQNYVQNFPDSSYGDETLRTTSISLPSHFYEYSLIMGFAMYIPD